MAVVRTRDANQITLTRTHHGRECQATGDRAVSDLLSSPGSGVNVTVTQGRSSGSAGEMS